MSFEDWSTTWFEWLPVVVVAVLASWFVGYEGFSDLRSDETFLLTSCLGFLLIGSRRYWRFAGLWLGMIAGLILNLLALWLLFDVCFPAVRNLDRGLEAVVLVLQVAIWAAAFVAIQKVRRNRGRRLSAE